MAHYLVTYTDSESERIAADTIEPAGDQYIAWTGSTAAAYIPTINVRSIVRIGDGQAVSG